MAERYKHGQTFRINKGMSTHFSELQTRYYESAKNTEHPIARSGQLLSGKLSLPFIPLQSATHLLPVLLLTFSNLGDTELCRTGTGGSIMHKQPRTGTKSALVQVPTGGFSLSFL